MPTGLAPPRAWLSAYAQVTRRDASGSGVPLARGCARARPPRALVLTLKPRTRRIGRVTLWEGRPESYDPEGGQDFVPGAEQRIAPIL